MRFPDKDQFNIVSAPHGHPMNGIFSAYYQAAQCWEGSTCLTERVVSSFDVFNDERQRWFGLKVRIERVDRYRSGSDLTDRDLLR